MKHLIFCLSIICVFIIEGCGGKPLIESRIKDYMKDTVVPRFDDPSSYQFVSLRVDTFTGKDFIKNIRALYQDGDTIIHSQGDITLKRQEADSLEKLPNYSDSVWNYQAIINFRGKNKMGALILDSVSLLYDPRKDAISLR